MNTDGAVRRLAEVLRRKQLALATERSYCAWLRRYCDYLKGLPSHTSSEQKPERFLTHLAKKGVAASTQNQVFNAIIFFYTEALCVEPGAAANGRVARRMTGANSLPSRILPRQWPEKYRTEIGQESDRNRTGS